MTTWKLVGFKWSSGQIDLIGYCLLSILVVTWFCKSKADECSNREVNGLAMQNLSFGDNKWCKMTDEHHLLDFMNWSALVLRYDNFDPDLKMLPRWWSPGRLSQEAMSLLWRQVDLSHSARPPNSSELLRRTVLFENTKILSDFS